MAEFEDRLNAILGDPEAMGQIVSIAKALTGEGGAPGTAEEEAPSQGPVPPPQEQPAPEAPPGPAAGQPDWSALLGMLGNGAAGDSPLAALGSLDPELIQTAVTLFSEYSAGDNQKVALLTALKPFLKPERQVKVDKAIQLARLSRVIRVALQMFQSNREEGGQDV